MNMVQSLVEMVTKLNCEVQALKSDTIALKLQLRDLRHLRRPQQQRPFHLQMMLLLKRIGMF
jgi:hypothetical protein